VDEEELKKDEKETSSGRICYKELEIELQKE
jgi:hypothetical protein